MGLPKKIGLEGDIPFTPDDKLYIGGDLLGVLIHFLEVGDIFDGEAAELGAPFPGGE